MNAEYHIIGAENSPYSVKVRAYFRYKGIPHRWSSRGEAAETFEQHAKLPLIPLVITPQGQAMQDSTPIIETMEAQYPEPGIHPAPPSRFISALLEEFADEWGNKWMFHYRWAREADQRAASRRLVEEMLPGLEDEHLEASAERLRERMVDRLWYVGSNETTAPLIERSFRDTLTLLERHLDGRDFLFGGRPAFADFGLWCQIDSAAKDPTPAGIVDATGPRLREWLERMRDPAPSGDYEPWTALAPTLSPLLAEQVARLFLPWSAANAAALEAAREELEVALPGGTWRQRPQKYHAKSLAEIKRKLAEARDDESLVAVLEETGCLQWLD